MRIFGRIVAVIGLFYFAWLLYESGYVFGLSGIWKIFGSLVIAFGFWWAIKDFDKEY